MESANDQDRVPAPPPLLVAAVVVALEGLGFVVFGAFEAVNTTSGRVVMGSTTALFFVGYGAALVLCAWGLSRVATWARGPVLIAQLLSLGLAWNFRDAETVWFAVLLAVPALVVLVGMLHPQTIEALNDPPLDEPRDDLAD